MTATCIVNGCLKTIGLIDGICEKCRTKISNVHKSKKNKPKVSSNRDWPKYFKKAKSVFQKLRRVQDADENGCCKCVCGSWRKWNACDAGHWIPAKNLATCFDPTNVHPQTKIDNMNMDNPIVSNKYTEFMINKYGPEHLDRLKIKSVQPAKFTVAEFKILIDLWENEIKEIIIKKKL